MEPTIIEIESQINELRRFIPTNKDLDEAKVLLCKAQNILQKHIERSYPLSEWVHTRTAPKTESSYKQIPTEQE